MANFPVGQAREQNIVRPFGVATSYAADDNFDDNVINSVLWTVMDTGPNVSVTEAGQDLDIIYDAPTYPSIRGTGVAGSGTTSFVAAVPTGGSAPVSGDAMYIIMESSDSSTAAGTPNTPSGWTKLFEQTVQSGASNVTTLTIFGKIAGSSESDVTVDGVGDHCVGALTVVQDHGMNAITDTVVGTGATGLGSTVTLNAVTVAATTLCLLCGGSSIDSASSWSSWTNANLTSITEIIDTFTTTGAGGGVGVATGRKGAEGSTGSSFSSTAGTNYWVAVMLGIPSQHANVNGGLELNGWPYDFTDQNVSIRFKGTGVSGDGAYEMILQLVDPDTDDLIRLVYYGWANAYQLQYNTGGGFINIGGTRAYSVGTSDYARLRVSGGDIFFDYSGNGSSWTNHVTDTLPIDVTNVKVQFYGQHWKQVAVGTTHTFDNFNSSLAIETFSRLLEFGQADESDDARAMIVDTGITVVLGQASETDSARAISWAPKRRLIGQVDETDTAETIQPPQRVGPTLETDAARTIRPAHSRVLGRPSETDAARAFDHFKVRGVARVAETDAARAIVGDVHSPPGTLTITEMLVTTITLTSEPITELAVSEELVTELVLA